MTTAYKFKATFTKSGVAEAPSSAPTIKVVDADNNILVPALTATTALTNLPGTYIYSYSGADGLDLIGRFTTTDTTMDMTDLDSYTSDNITSNLDVAVSTRSSHSAADVWAVASRAITDKTGFELTSAYDAAKNAATQASVNSIPTNPLLANDARIPATVIAAAEDLTGFDTETIEAIKAKTDLLGVSEIVRVIGPVLEGGNIEIVAGDDYFEVDGGGGLKWSSRMWPDLTDAEVIFTNGNFSKTMDVVTAGAGVNQVVMLELTKEESVAFQGNFQFSVTAKLTNTHSRTLVRASANILMK